MAGNAITRNPRPCWTLRWPDGSDVEYDDERGIPHYDTEAEAGRAAPGWATEDQVPPVPHELDDACWVAVALCGYLFDAEDDGVQHQFDPATLRDVALGAGWRPGPDGTLLCAGDDCDCANLPVRERPTELPGQLALIGADIPLDERR